MNADKARSETAKYFDFDKHMDMYTDKYIDDAIKQGKYSTWINPDGKPDGMGWREYADGCEKALRDLGFNIFPDSKTNSVTQFHISWER